MKYMVQLCSKTGLHHSSLLRSASEACFRSVTSLAVTRCATGLPDASRCSAPSSSTARISLRRGGGRVDGATGGWLVGAKSEYPFRLPFCEAAPRVKSAVSFFSSPLSPRSGEPVGGPSVVDHPSVRALVVAPRRVPAHRGVRRGRASSIFRLSPAAKDTRALIAPVTLRLGSVTNGYRRGRLTPRSPRAWGRGRRAPD
jgi:hypothetical protein